MHPNLAQQYDGIFSTLIGLHAPLVTKNVPPPCLPNHGCLRTSQRFRRYLERAWRRNPTALNRSRLTRQTHLCNRQMSKAKLIHYSKIIAEHSGDYRSLRISFSKFLHLCPNMHLPDHTSIDTIANKFSTFFINKVSIIFFLL